VHDAAHGLERKGRPLPGWLDVAPTRAPGRCRRRPSLLRSRRGPVDRRWIPASIRWGRGGTGHAAVVRAIGDLDPRARETRPTGGDPTAGSVRDFNTGSPTGLLTGAARRRWEAGRLHRRRPGAPGDGRAGPGSSGSRRNMTLGGVQPNRSRAGRYSREGRRPSRRRCRPGPRSSGKQPAVEEAGTSCLFHEVADDEEVLDDVGGTQNAVAAGVCKHPEDARGRRAGLPWPGGRPRLR